MKMLECFEDLETEREYNGYIYSVSKAAVIVVLGSICGLRNTSQIHQWAENERVVNFLTENFGITKIPSYFWLLSLMKLVKPESSNRCFENWAQSLMSETGGWTLALDGKTICSTAKMSRRENPLHIVSAEVAELGITLGQKTVDEKSNEIPALRELIKELNIKDCVVVADAMHCQRETAQLIVDSKGNYLLPVKDNQANLKRDIEEYAQDKRLQAAMDTCDKFEKNYGRRETRKALTACDVKWLSDNGEWANLSCIGALKKVVKSKKGETCEWRYYISSRKLSAEELLKHARLEWSVETMHWLLDVHFREDYCRVEDTKIRKT